MRLSQIAKLLDMPHYSGLRMQILKPMKYPSLINTLKGMLMLLPQGKAFDSLKNRLECASLVLGPEPGNETPEPPIESPNVFITKILDQSPDLFQDVDKISVLAELN